jgi:hypothetical protein
LIAILVLIFWGSIGLPSESFHTLSFCEAFWSTVRIALLNNIFVLLERIFPTESHRGTKAFSGFCFGAGGKLLERIYLMGNGTAAFDGTVSTCFLALRLRR